MSSSSESAFNCGNLRVIFKTRLLSEINSRKFGFSVPLSSQNSTLLGVWLEKNI